MATKQRDTDDIVAINIKTRNMEKKSKKDSALIHWLTDLLCLTPISAIFQLYHGDHQFLWWKKPEYPERTTDHEQATGKLYHLQLRVECTLFCNLQSQVQTDVVLVIGLYELLGNPTT